MSPPIPPNSSVPLCSNVAGACDDSDRFSVHLSYAPLNFRLTFCESMDFSLWDPPICEDESSEFGGNFVENWWQTDFHSGYGFHDVIDEDALNEKACMQVLKITLSRAETEIAEVEKEIAVLQRQLDEVWSKKPSTLRERIKSLDGLIQRFQNKEQAENALDFHFQTLGERAGELRVMLETLLESYSPNRDVQLPLMLNMSPDIDKLVPIQSNEETKSSTSTATSCGTKILGETVKILDIQAEVDKRANAVMTNTNTGSLRSEAGSECITRPCNHLEETTGGITLKPSSIPNETTVAEEDMLADITSDSGIQVDMTGKSTAECHPKMKVKEACISCPESSDSERTIGESLEELRRREKAQIVEQVQNTVVAGKEPHKSNLLLKSGSPKLTGKQFPIDPLGAPKPSLAMEMDRKISSLENLNKNTSSRIHGNVGKKCRMKRNNKESCLNFKGDKSNSDTADVNFDKLLPSIGETKKCQASPLRKKHEATRNLQVNSKMDEDLTSCLIKKEEDIFKDALLTPPNVSPSSTGMVAYNSLSMPQLRAIAKARNLKRYSKLKKSDLIKLLV